MGFHPSFQREVDALDVARRAADEIGANKFSVGQGVDGKFQSMAVEADASEHFLVWSEIEILVVLNQHAGSSVDGPALSGQVAGGAGHTAAGRPVAGEFLLPEIEVR
jgi:hypothetical protein